jgi:hypothetical protein
VRALEGFHETESLASGIPVLGNREPRSYWENGKALLQTRRASVCADWSPAASEFVFSASFNPMILSIKFSSGNVHPGMPSSWATLTDASPSFRLVVPGSTPVSPNTALMDLPL